MSRAIGWAPSLLPSRGSIRSHAQGSISHSHTTAAIGRSRKPAQHALLLRCLNSGAWLSLRHVVPTTGSYADHTGCDMRRFGWIAPALIALTLVAAPAAQAEKRVALLIGNKDYKSGVGALVNPLNDLRVMGEALKAVGFEVLKPAQNAKRADMLIAIHNFASKLKGAG